MSERCFSFYVNCLPLPTDMHISILVTVTFPSRNGSSGGGDRSAFQDRDSSLHSVSAIACTFVKLPNQLLELNVSQTSQSLWIKLNFIPSQKICLSTVVPTCFQSSYFLSGVILDFAPFLSLPHPTHTISDQVLLILLLNFSKIYL